MMTKPEDREENCKVRMEGFICSRPAGHDGDHIAMAGKNAVRTWPQRPPAPSPSHKPQLDLCGAPSPHMGQVCRLQKGHTGNHVDGNCAEWPNESDLTLKQRVERIEEALRVGEKAFKRYNTKIKALFALVDKVDLEALNDRKAIKDRLDSLANVVEKEITGAPKGPRMKREEAPQWLVMYCRDYGIPLPRMIPPEELELHLSKNAKGESRPCMDWGKLEEWALYIAMDSGSRWYQYGIRIDNGEWNEGSMRIHDENAPKWQGKPEDSLTTVPGRGEG